jgi:hypothetical protein
LPAGELSHPIRNLALAKDSQIPNFLIATGIGVIVLEARHRHRDRSVPAVGLIWIIVTEAGLKLCKRLSYRAGVRPAKAS